MIDVTAAIAWSEANIHPFAALVLGGLAARATYLWLLKLDAWLGEMWDRRAAKRLMFTAPRADATTLVQACPERCAGSLTSAAAPGSTSGSPNRSPS